MTDVNIAVEMLKDAYDDACDTTLLVSATCPRRWRRSRPVFPGNG